MNATQIKILEAAEAEVAEAGFSGASIRRITQRAGVNVASINYHFGSKEELIKALFRYRLIPLNNLRLELLAKEQAKHEDGIVPVPVLVGILIRPAVERLITKNGRCFVQAMGRCMSEPQDYMADLDKEIFREIFTAFCQAFQKSMPELDLNTVVTQMNFVVCSLVGLMMHFPRAEFFLGHELSEQDFQQFLDQYIHFISAGIEGARVPVL